MLANEVIILQLKKEVGKISVSKKDGGDSREDKTTVWKLILCNDFCCSNQFNQNFINFHVEK